MDIQLHCTWCGDGPPLLLLHGNGENSSYFEHQIKEFSKAFSVCAIDTRGHGLSPVGDAPFTISQFADDLADFMDENGLEQADILGFSDGGNIALLFALRHPEQVSRLILNSSNLWPEGLTDELLDDIGPRYEEICKSEEEEEQYEAALLALMLQEPHIDPQDLQRLTMPVLVIAGDHDLIRPEHTELIAASIPGSHLVILPGDHCIANSNPISFNEAVWNFFEEEPL